MLAGIDPTCASRPPWERSQDADGTLGEANGAGIPPVPMTMSGVMGKM